MRRPVVALLALILLVTLANGYGNLHDSSRINGVVSRLKGDETATKRTAEHTRVVQVQGGPVAVCLREVMENVAPLLERVPTVEQPLAAYVHLQSKRYIGVVCPDKRPDKP